LLTLLVVPRLALVLPAAALGERLSLRQAWRSTRANALRLALATCLCMLPAVGLFTLLPSLLGYLDRTWTFGVDTPIGYVIRQLVDSPVYAVFNSLGSAVVAILAVTLLSLTYRFFGRGPDERQTGPSPVESTA
jgi:hypothetical protein